MTNRIWQALLAIVVTLFVLAGVTTCEQYFKREIWKHEQRALINTETPSQFVGLNFVLDENKPDCIAKIVEDTTYGAETREYVCWAVEICGGGESWESLHKGQSYEECRDFLEEQQSRD